MCVSLIFSHTFHKFHSLVHLYALPNYSKWKLILAHTCIAHISGHQICSSIEFTRYESKCTSFSQRMVRLWLKRFICSFNSVHFQSVKRQKNKFDISWEHSNIFASCSFAFSSVVLWLFSFVGKFLQKESPESFSLKFYNANLNLSQK